MVCFVRPSLTCVVIAFSTATIALPIVGWWGGFGRTARGYVLSGMLACLAVGCLAAFIETRTRPYLWIASALLAGAVFKLVRMASGS